MSKLFLIAGTAIALVSAPIGVEAQTPSAPPVQSEPATETIDGSAMAGVGSPVWIGLGVLALVLLLVLIDDDDEEDVDLPASP